MKTKRMFMLLLVLVSVVIAGFVAINIKNGLNVKMAEAAGTGENVLYVGGSGANNYTKIQDAINDANNGDTIFVYDGTYEEQIIVDKSIIIKGEDLNTIVIGGFYVVANYTTIENFSITQGYEWNGIYRAGIYAISSNNAFCNNHIWDISGGNGGDGGNGGFYSGDGGDGGIGAGIYLQSSNNNNISSNTISNITGGTGGDGEGYGGDGGDGGIGAGIYLQSSNNNNYISYCNISNNDYGISLYYSSSNNEIHYNNIYNNKDYGIRNYNTQSQYVVNASYNWWGSSDGPSGVGPGSGDDVSQNVIYEPWLTEPWRAEAHLNVSIFCNHSLYSGEEIPFYVLVYSAIIVCIQGRKFHFMCW